MSNFGVNLRDELKFQGICIKELSKKTNILEGTLESYRRTKATEPTVENAVKIAQALNVSVEHLVLGDDSKFDNRRKPLSREAQEVIKLAQTLNSKQCKIIINLVKEFGG